MSTTDVGASETRSAFVRSERVPIPADPVGSSSKIRHTHDVRPPVRVLCRARTREAKESSVAREWLQRSVAESGLVCRVLAVTSIVADSSDSSTRISPISLQPLVPPGRVAEADSGDQTERRVRASRPLPALALGIRQRSPPVPLARAAFERLATARPAAASQAAIVREGKFAVEETVEKTCCRPPLQPLYI